MSATPVSGSGRAGMGAGMEQVSSWSRDIRLVSGVILLVFATTHFLNHALGIFGVAVMEEARTWRGRVMKGMIIAAAAMVVAVVM